MRVLILGASNNPERYAYKAAERLSKAGHEIVLVGVRKATVFEKEIINTKEIQPDIHTITLYVGPQILQEWKQYIIDTKPQRVIFNPGTEDEEFEQILTEKGINVEVNCTLVMLSLNHF